MKKIFFYIMFAVAGLSLQSCLHDDDEIFDKSAAERINEAVANAKEVLTSSQEGWVMHYYAGREYAYGGLNLAMKFTDGKVQMYNETATNKDGSYKSVVSTYKITRDQGPVLAFDTYNDLLHIYGDPAGSGAPTDVDGWEADYEFVIMNISEDQNTITLKGKKFNNTIVLERLTRPVAEYFDAASKMAESLTNTGILAYTVGDKRAKFYPGSSEYSVKYVDDKGEVASLTVPYTSTDKGLLFNEPIELFGDTLKGINAKDTATVNDVLTANTIVVSNDESKTFSLSNDLSDIFQKGNWYLALSNMGEVAGPGLQSFIDGCKDSEGEDVNYCYIGTYKGYYGFYFLSGGKYNGVATFAVDAPINEPDVITFDFNGYDSSTLGFSNGEYYADKCNFEDAYTPFLSTFKLSTDDVNNPTVMTLTDQNNAKNVIKLVKEPVLYPGKH